MVKLLKISGRLLGIVIEWLLIFITIFAFAIRTSPVQTYLAQKATDYLSKELKTKVHVGGVSIVFIDRIALDDVSILDLEKDTLAGIQRIYITVDKIDLNKQKIELGRVELEGGNIHLKRAAETGSYNYAFLVDYFSSEKKSKRKSKPVVLALEELELTNVDFTYDDYRKKYSDFGIDFNHIRLKKVNLTANDLSIHQGKVHFHISQLSAREKSGFILDQLETTGTIGGDGIHLTDTKILTQRSEVKSNKFALLFDEPEDLQSFEDSVQFDGEFLLSSVSLYDISFFARALKGMDAQVTLKGKINDFIPKLKLRDLYLATGKRTMIQGNFNLPDFRDFENSFFSEKINKAFIDLNDLKKIKMPESNGSRYLTFDKYLERLGYFQLRNFRLDGYYSNFVLAGEHIQTNIGAVRADNGIMFTQNKKNNSFFFERSQASEYDVKIESFNLSAFLDDRNFGMVDGTFFLSGEAFSLADIRFSLMEGNVNRFDYMGYPYSDIVIQNGSLIDKVFTARVEVEDDNLNLVYDGYIDFKGDQQMNFSIDLTKALLENLNITTKEDGNLRSNFRVNMFGKDLDRMYGIIALDGIIYTEGDKTIEVPELSIKVERHPVDDVFSIKSLLGDFEMKGKVEFSSVVNDFIRQFDKVFPGLLNNPSVLSSTNKSKSRFSYDFKTNQMDEFLGIFAPDLKIQSGTHLRGAYDGASEDFTMILTSGLITYQDFRFEGVDIDQKLTSSSIVADYHIDQFQYGDSISIQDVYFTTAGKNNILHSDLMWNQNRNNASHISWESIIVDNTQLLIQLEPSYFSINDQRWEVEKSSDILISNVDIHVSKFKLSRGSQFIAIDGCISRNDSDKLNFRVNDINLRELTSMVGLTTELDGYLHGWGSISNPYDNLNYIGDASIMGLRVDNQEVGDVFVQSQWNKGSESIRLLGDMIYRGNQTFAFQGNYFTDRKENSLDLYLNFDNTDIQFVNAFMDPEVISNIKGQLQGNLKVTGEPDDPKLDGRLNLVNGNAKMELLGVNYGFNGQVIVDEYGFYINHMPITDEEGNTGSMVASVYHEAYDNWNFDLQIDIESNDINTDIFSWAPSNTAPERFLILNTSYKEGDYYYGKAYGSGNVNIFGYLDHLEITVDMKTRRGTRVNFPMYGVSDFDEEESFIRFINKDTAIAILERKFDFTGVDLKLNIKATPEAKLKIIFNEQLGDEITADGTGDISLRMDNLGDMKLDGTYRIREGVYNFAMGPIKQPFFIQEGGTITWTGDPYNATLNLNTYYRANASLSEISPNELHGSANINNQEILCYLNLTESLMKPSIGFNIAAPKANETGKALLARINSDPDELNRQFFSLLLWKRFQPLRGSTAANSSAALDLVANQINSMLASVSKDYKLNLNLDGSSLPGEGSSYELGVSKQFLDNRLIVQGSFGVERNVPTGTQNQNMLVGDVSVEYLLNESGTFRISIFNESNDYSVIQDKNLGLFTQGAGIQYHEDFDNAENFMLLQYLFDIFRSKENKKISTKRKKEQTPVPKNGSEPVVYMIPTDPIQRNRP
jgi:hypothetical protein